MSFCRKEHLRAWLLAGAVLVIAMAGALAQTSPAPRVRATGIRYPNYDVDGSLKSVIEGESASILSNEDVDVSSLVMEIMGVSGGVTRIRADDCVYRPEPGTAESDSPVRMEYGGTLVKGNGFVWRREDDRVHIKRDVDVAVSNAAEWTSAPGFGGGAAATGPVFITSSEMEFRPDKETGIFENNVRVVRSGMTVTSDKLSVSLEQKRALSKITATGSVVIVQGDSTGTCARAVIDADSATITMSGGARFVRAGEEMGGQDIEIMQGRDRIIAQSGYLRFKGIRRLRTE